MPRKIISSAIDSSVNQTVNAAANLVAVYANGTLTMANANLNFINTSTVNATISANSTNKFANISFSAGAAQADTNPPSNPRAGQLWFDTSATKMYQYYDNVWVEFGTSQVSNIYGRNTLWANTSSLAAGANQSSNVSAFKSYVLMTVYTSSAAWVRIYTDYASLLADASRSISTDPTAGSGIIADIATTGATTQKITPFLFGGNLDSPPTSNMYVSITNTSGVSAAINTAITITRLET